MTSKTQGFGNGVAATTAEETEQFLCSMLGDESEVSLGVVRNVLCQCGYEVEKALDALLELASSSKKRGNSSEHTPKTYAHVLAGKSEAHKSRSSNLSQMVLESLFIYPKTSEPQYQEPRNMKSWKNLVKELQDAKGPEFDVAKGSIQCNAQRKPTKPSRHPFNKEKMALSNNVIAAINFVAMLLSIPIIGAGIWLATEPDNSCVKILQWPVIILGILFLVVAIAGFVGAFWRIPWLLVSYLIAMLILIVLLACLVVFIYMVTMRGSGHLEPSRSYLEYHLDDYSGWLRRRVRAPFKWDRSMLLLFNAFFTASAFNQSSVICQK